MATEQEKRLHRCCFSGHRPEKLDVDPETVKQWLSAQIDAAIAAGYRTFISGCGMGVDIWAAQIVLQKKATNPALRLIAATPWPGFSNRWNIEWQLQYSNLLRDADLVLPVSNHYQKDISTVLQAAPGTPSPMRIIKGLKLLPTIRNMWEK